MERGGYIPAIQTRGTGSGLDISDDISLDKPVIFMSLRYDLVKLSKRSEMNASRMRAVWTQNLERQLFVLTNRKPESFFVSLKEQRKIEKEGTSSDHCSSLIPSAIGSTLSSPPPHLTQFIPELAPDIPTLITYWRKGSEQTNNAPLRLFLSSDCRSTACRFPLTLNGEIVDSVVRFSA